LKNEFNFALTHAYIGVIDHTVGKHEMREKK